MRDQTPHRLQAQPSSLDSPQVPQLPIRGFRSRGRTWTNCRASAGPSANLRCGNGGIESGLLVSRSCCGSGSSPPPLTTRKGRAIIRTTGDLPIRCLFAALLVAARSAARVGTRGFRLPSPLLVQDEQGRQPAAARELRRLVTYGLLSTASHGFALQGGPRPHSPAVARGHRATSPVRAPSGQNPVLPGL